MRRDNGKYEMPLAYI